MEDDEIDDGIELHIPVKYDRQTKCLMFTERGALAHEAWQKFCRELKQGKAD